MCRARRAPGFARFSAMMARLTRPDAARTPGQLIEDVLTGGYGEYLRAEFSADERREEDIRQLAEYAGRFEDLPRFLSEIALVSEFSAEDADAARSPDEYLTLSTSTRPRGWSGGPSSSSGWPRGASRSSRAIRDPEEEEEERRLFYVAVTRARDELALTYPLTTNPQDGRARHPAPVPLHRGAARPAPEDRHRTSRRILEAMGEQRAPSAGGLSKPKPSPRCRTTWPETGVPGPRRGTEFTRAVSLLWPAPLDSHGGQTSHRRD